MAKLEPCETCPWRWVREEKIPKTHPRCRTRAGTPCVGLMLRKKELKEKSL